MGLKFSLVVSAAILSCAAPLNSQTPAPAAASVAPDLSYADLADLAAAAPVAAHVFLRKASPLKGAQAAGVPAGRTRFLVESEVMALIRGDDGLPKRVTYLADVPNVGGRPPKLRRKSQYLVVGSRVPNKPGELRLAAPDAQIPYTAVRARQLRAILREAIQPGAAPRISGVGRAFHVPGAVPGESETQFFLRADDGRPVSMNVLRRPGQQPQWAVSLSEIVDEAATTPQANTLLWYRLACGLPASLPAQSLEEGNAEAIAADYALIRQSLGPCTRTRRQV